MASNFNKERAYSNIVKKIIEKLPDEADKKFVSENINIITKNLVTFSDYVRKIMDISSEKIPISSKIKKVTETKIFDSTLKLDEAREIINKLYQEFNKKIQIGGTIKEGVKKEKTVDVAASKDDIDEDDDEDDDEDEDDSDEDSDDEGKKESYDKNKEEDKFDDYRELGQGDKLKSLGEKDNERARNWWENLGFIYFSEHTEKDHVKKYLMKVLEDKKYNMILIINTLCMRDSLEEAKPKCMLKNTDLKQSVRDFFINELKSDDPNRETRIETYNEDIGKALAAIFNDLVTNEKIVLTTIDNHDSNNRLLNLSTEVKRDHNLLKYIFTERSETIYKTRSQYKGDIEKLQIEQDKLNSTKGVESSFINERIKNLEFNIECLDDIIEKIEEYQDDPEGYTKDDDEDDTDDDEDDDYAEKYEDSVDALEKERGEDDLDNLLDTLKVELGDSFEKEGPTARRIRNYIENERKNASTKAFKEVATKTVEDPVTNDLNEKLEAIKKDNPHCKLPQYAINPIKIAALKKMRQNVDASVGFCFSNMTLLATKLFSSFPKYSSLILSKWFHDLSKLYNFDWHDFADFSRKLDWVYLYLFIMSSVPFLGFWSDLLIIVRAIKEGRGFLSILTFVTSFISMFTFHMIDVGMIIKLLYFLDTTSYNSAKYDGSKPNMIDSDVVFSRGSVDFNVAKDFISGKTRKKSKKEDKSLFSVAEDMMESMIKDKEKEKGIVHDEDDDDDDFSGPSQFSDDKKTGIKHRKKQISQEDKCDSNLKKLKAIMENENINMNSDELGQIIDSTNCNYKEALNQIIEKVGGKEESDGDDDEDDDENYEITNTSKEDYLRKDTKGIKPDGKVIKKRISRTDDEAGIDSFKRKPMIDKDEESEVVRVGVDGNPLEKYGALAQAKRGNREVHLWDNCERYNYEVNPNKRKLDDYCHYCFDPITGTIIGGKTPQDFNITHKETLKDWDDFVKTDDAYRESKLDDWEIHYNLLTKFMDKTSNSIRNQTLAKIKQMLKEPEQQASDEEYVIDDEEPEEQRKAIKKPKPRIQPDINPATGIFAQIGKIGQFGKSNQPIIVDDDEEIKVDDLTKPESGVGYPRDFGKQHQEIEKFKPCDQAGVDCAQSIHGIAYKPNYKTKVCEKVKLVAKPNLFGTSISRDKPHGAKEYTIVGRDKGHAKNNCQKDLNNEITTDLTKDIPGAVDKRDVTKITKYLSELREKYGKLINNKKAVMTDWNRNKSELEKIVTNANHGIDFTKKGFDEAVYKCIPHTYQKSRSGFKKGNCVWSPSGKKALGDDVAMHWKPEGKLYKNNEREECQQACVDTLNNGSENSDLMRALKGKEADIQHLLENGEIDEIMRIIDGTEEEIIDDFKDEQPVVKNNKKIKKEKGLQLL